jgi:caffeoyl-CoA O-methyltransferase
MSQETKTSQFKSLRAVSPGTIVASKLSELTTVLHEGTVLEAEMAHLLSEIRDLATGLEDYVASCTTPESPALAQLVAATNCIDWKNTYTNGQSLLELEPEMVSGHVEGQFLKFIVGMMKVHTILEIGVFTGYSALAMAEALPDDGRLLACEIDPYAASFAQKQFDLSKDGKKIDLIVGNAIDSIQQLSDSGNSFDLIFIDADKSGYQAYLDIILEGSLLGPNGLICVDNTLMQGQPFMPGPKTPNGEAITRFNLSLVNDSRVEQVLLPLRDGLTLIRRV